MCIKLFIITSITEFSCVEFKHLTLEKRLIHRIYKLRELWIARSSCELQYIDRLTFTLHGTVTWHFLFWVLKSRRMTQCLMELHFWVRSDMPDACILSVYRRSGRHQCLWIRRSLFLSVLDGGGCRDLSRQRTPTCLTKNSHKITRPWKYIFTHLATPHVILHSTTGTGVAKRANKHWKITHVRISSVTRRRIAHFRQVRRKDSREITLLPKFSMCHMTCEKSFWVTHYGNSWSTY